MRYIDGDEHRENEEAKRNGVPVSTIAERRHMEVAVLCRLMGWPQWQLLPTGNMLDEQPADYLWSCDRLDGVL